MIALIAIWTALLVATIALVSRSKGQGALLLCYFLTLSLIHVPGAINYLGDAPELSGRMETLLGFRATLVGLAALLVGAGLHLWLSARSRRNTRRETDPAQVLRIGRLCLAWGLIVYFVAIPLAGYIPSATAVVSPLGGLIIIAIWLFLQDAVRRRDGPRTTSILAATPLLPISTLMFGGFAGYGVAWMVSIFSYLYSLSRRRVVFVLVFPLAAWLGLSVGAAYFAQRDTIREAVWGLASLSVRVESILAIGQTFKLYDLNDVEQVRAIDGRLNQNFLVGAAILQHEELGGELLDGESLQLWLLVPRAIWPDKPAVAGSGDIVTRMTGISFAAGTSVGAGQPLEFYANFGWVGLVVGFILLGITIAHHDNGLRLSIQRGDLRSTLKFGLPGLVLMQPGGSISEILVGFVSAVMMSRVITVGMRQSEKLFRSSRRKPVGSGSRKQSPRTKSS
jgi:hypothetical protein